MVQLVTKWVFADPEQDARWHAAGADLHAQECDADARVPGQSSRSEQAAPVPAVSQVVQQQSSAGAAHTSSHWRETVQVLLLRATLQAAQSCTTTHASPHRSVTHHQLQYYIHTLVIYHVYGFIITRCFSCTYYVRIITLKLIVAIRSLLKLPSNTINVWFKCVTGNERSPE